MFLFRPVLSPVENSISPHPWAGQIKDIYSRKIKYAHNSIRNPIYPKNKENFSRNQRKYDKIKFTIIGDRITKEFIYCVNLVKGLHQCRKKIFDSPVIRGVTTVEWPSVWNDLKVKFGAIAFCLRSKVAVLLDGELLGGEEELQELVKTKYDYRLYLDYYKESVEEFAKYIKSAARPCAYMSISIDGDDIGHFIFMLYSDIVPTTCENFLRLCKETKGGYSGTPVHRIVKDGWIQCGGFGLKSTDLICENFIVPHDRRGVLCMANDGRDIDCSTQFFVLLQPAPWMASKYVALGQLIEGKETLEKIEAIPTWYESPKSEIMIYKAGIFNIDCHDYIINKGTDKYIDSHIEDLNALADFLFEVIIDEVFVTIQLKDVECLGEQPDEQMKSEEYSVMALNSEDSVKNNSEFDVESYDPEGLEVIEYEHQSLKSTSLVVKPRKPYYLPLTDVLYPGEKDSDFNLRRFVQGEYCLESDLQFVKVIPHQGRISYSSDFIELEDSETETESERLDSDDEKEIQRYLMLNSDRVSFAGGVIRKISKGSGNIHLFSAARKSELITDDQLRRLRLASLSRGQHSRDRHVSMSVDADDEKVQHKIIRRETGFVRLEDLETIRTFHKDSSDDESEQESDDRRVRIHPSTAESRGHTARRLTPFVRPTDVRHADDEDDGQESEQKVLMCPPGNVESRGAPGRPVTDYARVTYFDGSDEEREIRRSVLFRLFEDVKRDEEPPTLKHYKPMSESKQKNILFSSNYRVQNDESLKEKYRFQSEMLENVLDDSVLSIQYGNRVSRGISSDYVKTIEQIEHRVMINSLRSVEFAKTRPTLTVAEYQMKNREYQENLKRAPAKNLDEESSGQTLRMPTSPPYSKSDVIAPQRAPSHPALPLKHHRRHHDHQRR